MVFDRVVLPAVECSACGEELARGPVLELELEGDLPASHGRVRSTVCARKSSDSRGERESERETVTRNSSR